MLTPGVSRLHEPSTLNDLAFVLLRNKLYIIITLSNNARSAFPLEK